MTEGVDYSYTRPSPGGLVAAGKSFVVRYGGPGQLGKLIAPLEARALTQAGLVIVANAEGDKGGLAGGRLAGTAWAAAADAMFRACGMPADRPIYFSVDWDVRSVEWPAVFDALRGCADVIGVERVGIYGGRAAITWARRDGVARWFWQTYAWSGGAWAPGNHIEQYRNNITLAGGAVDLDRALVTDYGQWRAYDGTMTTNPEFSGIDWIGPAAAGHGSFAHRYLVWHCTENPTSDAVGEANFARTRSDGIGTHFVADETRAIQTLETFKAVGHVGSSVGNDFGIALEMCGVLTSSVAHYRRVTDVAMPAIRKACAKWGIPARWLTSAQANDGVSKGWLTHDDARRYWGSTTHTDPGPNFDRTYAVDSFNAVAPPPSAPTAYQEEQMILTCTDGSGAEKSLNNVTVPIQGRVLATPNGPWSLSGSNVGGFDSTFWKNTPQMSWADIKAYCVQLVPPVSDTPVQVQIDAAPVAAAIVADPSLGDLIYNKSFQAAQDSENR